MKTIRKYPLLVALIFCACSCADDTPSHATDPGAIIFTSNQDCNIRLFDDCENQITRTDYEVGKSPAIVYMKQIGVYYIFAENCIKTKLDSINYCGGNIEFYIEF